MIGKLVKQNSSPWLNTVMANPIYTLIILCGWCVAPLIFIVLLCAPAIADPYVNGTFNFRRLLTMEQGVLGPGRITAIAQDRQGYIWIGGSNGLARYDGKNFQMFNYDEDDPHSLNSNSVFDIEVDAQGEMWVVTSDQLNRFDRDKESFIRYEDMQFETSNETILSTDSDSKGRLFFITGKGLYTYSPVANPLIPVHWQNRKIAEWIDHPYQLFIDRRDRLWISSHIDGLLMVDLEREKMHHWSENNQTVDVLDSNNIKNVFQDSLGNIWVATVRGVLKISEDLATQKIFHGDENNPSALSRDITEAIGEDKNGRIWIATWNLGISIYDPQAQRFTQLKKNGQDPAGIQSNATQMIFKDRMGDLWLVAYPLGIDYWDANSYEIIRKVHDPENDNSLSNSGIRCIHSDSRGYVWIGTQEGLNRYDPNTANFKRYTKDLLNLDETTGLKSNTILSIEEDGDQLLWIGTYGGGLHKLNTVTERVTHYPVKNGTGGYAETIVWSILRDSDNIIWIGAEGGLARYDRTTDSFTYFRKNLERSQSVQSVLELNKETLLVGTTWGLYLFDKKSEQWSRVGATSPFIPSHIVANIAMMPSGDAWVATADGIVFINSHGEPVGRLGVADGLPEKAVASLLLAEDGMVWAATANGVAVINPISKRIITLYRHNGLACDTYRHGALFHEDSVNNIYLGGNNGLSIVSRQDFFNSVQNQTINVEFLRLKIFNQLMFPGAEGSPLERPLPETKNIQLAHSQNVFSLEFAAVNHKIGERLEYEYKLEGLTSDWSKAASQIIGFSNLNPGQYRLLVRAHEPGVFDPADYSVLNIEILPAPWLSVYAKGAYFVLLLLAGYGVYVARRLQNKKCEAESAAAAKTEFFATMSHEIRTPLTGVLGMLAFALKDSTIAPQTLMRLHTAKASAKALLGITNDILDITKIEAGKLTPENIGFDLKAVAQRSIDTFKMRARQKNLSLNLTLADELPRYIKGDPTRLAQVFEKLMDNAIKFTQQGFVTLTVKIISTAEAGRAGRWLQFQVEDSGIGISAANIDRLFIKFAQADVSNIRESGGTGLGLAISKQLVQLMGGQIQVISTLGDGSIFQFTLPLVTAEYDELQLDGAIGIHPRQLNILCAEDFVTNQLIIGSLIEVMGHQLTLVNDGAEAIEALLVNKYDLILMDGRMPKIDGIEATRIIRSGDWKGQAIEQKNIPIIALTASVSEEDITKFSQFGIAGYVTKPINNIALFRAIGAVIESVPGVGHSLAENAPNTNPVLVASDDPFALDSYGLTSTSIVQKLSYTTSDSLQKRLLVAFRTTLPDRLQEIILAKARCDFETLGRVFHGLKGGAAHLGDHALTAICSRLEQAADANDLDLIDKNESDFDVAIRPYLNIEHPPHHDERGRPDV